MMASLGTLAVGAAAPAAGLPVIGVWLAIAEEVPGKNEVTFTYFEIV